MSYLWLNTACHPRGLAVVTAGAVTTSSWWSEPRQDSRQIFAALEGLKKQAHALDLNAAGINGIVVVQGPGNFTGLRVGVTVANTLAYANGLPLYSVPTSRFLWACFHDRKGFIWPAGISGWFYSASANDVALVSKEDKATVARATLTDVLQAEEASENLPQALAQLVALVKPVVQTVPLYMKPADVTVSKASSK